MGNEKRCLVKLSQTITYHITVIVGREEDAETEAKMRFFDCPEDCPVSNGLDIKTEILRTVLL